MLRFKKAPYFTMCFTPVLVCFQHDFCRGPKTSSKLTFDFEVLKILLEIFENYADIPESEKLEGDFTIGREFLQGFSGVKLSYRDCRFSEVKYNYIVYVSLGLSII